MRFHPPCVILTFVLHFVVADVFVEAILGDVTAKTVSQLGGGTVGLITAAAAVFFTREKVMTGAVSPGGVAFSININSVKFHVLPLNLLVTGFDISNHMSSLAKPILDVVLCFLQRVKLTGMKQACGVGLVSINIRLAQNLNLLNDVHCFPFSYLIRIPKITIICQALYFAGFTVTGKNKRSLFLGVNSNDGFRVIIASG